MSGRIPDGTGLSSLRDEAAKASSPKASIPCAWLRELADRLDEARCWHVGDSTFGKTSSKWWNLLPTDVREAALRIRQYADAIAIETRSGATGTGVAEGKSAGPQDIAQGGEA